LLLNLFDAFWPELFELGALCFFRTPLIKVTLRDKGELEFFTEREFKAWATGEGAKLRGWTHKYFKGLGTHPTAAFSRYLTRLEAYLIALEPQDQADKDALDLAFNAQRAADRKRWLETPAASFEGLSAPSAKGPKHP